MLQLSPSPEIIPLVAIVFTMMVPVIVILTRHQQKMTILMRQDHESQDNQDLRAVQYEVQQLKSMVASIAMNVDDLKNEVKSQSQLQERVRIEE